MKLLAKKCFGVHFSIIVCMILLGCAKTFNPNIERGDSYNFRDGYPEVRFSAIGMIDEEGEPKINLTADIVYGSLVFKSKDSLYVSNIAIDVQIIDTDNSNTIFNERYNLSVEEKSPNIVNSQEVMNFRKQIPAEPGEYKINLTLTDLSSDKKITSVSQTYIPDPTNDVSNLTNIRMLGKNTSDGSEWSPITTYDVPGRIDSLKFVFQVTNNLSDKPFVVESRLIRFASDTTFARPMHYNNASPSMLRYKGIEYDDREVLQSNERRLLEPGNVLIELTFAQQQRGNYRFEIESQNGEEELFKARDFGVKSKNYPSIKSARELAKPLAYLMNEKEYEELLSIKKSDSLKKAVDRFWLKNVGNISKSRSVVEKYYQRVEEANKQFSNFKEGWKTDPGMIYILFGPPWYINSTLDMMEWSYSYNREDPSRNFLFYQPKFKSEFFPFQHFLLQRSQSYFSIQYQQAELWLSGLILQRNL